MIPVLNSPSAPYAHLLLRSRNAGAPPWFDRAVKALWDAGVQTGADPVVLVAQCALETNWGRFGGAVDATFNNTCGLKTVDASGDRPEDHQRFPADAAGRPWLGALAHAHHLRLYCGLPVPADSPDPRARFIAPGSVNFGSVLYVEDLGGKWAPAADYGVRAARIVTTVLTPT